MDTKLVESLILTFFLSAFGFGLLILWPLHYFRIKWMQEKSDSNPEEKQASEKKYKILAGTLVGIVVTLILAALGFFFYLLNLIAS
jgi:heme/copper-type cytochrome/quinol oxidase subunit 2